MTESPPETGTPYQVVARRYRPQSFESLVGQSQVSTALSNAINTNRVGHAYLFTGARGVGKTSSARIFAKCLNCEKGPTDTPCGVCDVCQAVNDGQDVDVIEIDGASNRGIDEIRELRANINVRPSRSRYKVYIIDEVHMLTTPAFNALLKTLEEPPSHVKFIFCTTDPEKIPITVLSRCQRFDFAPVESNAICDRLVEICKSEGFETELEALQLLARRANGSMRDSQSLLEQLLSFCEQKITLDDVNKMLGTADLGCVKAIGTEIIRRNARGAVEALSDAIADGVDCVQLGNQLVGFFRDILVVLSGCSKDVMLTANPNDFDEVKSLGESLGIDTTMAFLQILDGCLTKLKFSSHSRVLIEMALIRCCSLENLDAVSSLIKQAKDGMPLLVSTSGSVDSLPGSQKASLNESPSGSRPPSVMQPPSAKSVGQSAGDKPTRLLEPEIEKSDKKIKKKEIETEESTVRAKNSISVNSANIESIWKQTLAKLEDIAADYAGNYQSLAISAPNCLAVTLDSFYKEKCEVASVKSKLENTFAEIANQRFRIDFIASKGAANSDKKPVISKRQKMKELETHPLVRKAIEMFDGEIVDIRKMN